LGLISGLLFGVSFYRWLSREIGVGRMSTVCGTAITIWAAALAGGQLKAFGIDSDEEQADYTNALFLSFLGFMVLGFAVAYAFRKKPTSPAVPGDGR